MLDPWLLTWHVMSSTLNPTNAKHCQAVYFYPSNGSGTNLMVDMTYWFKRIIHKSFHLHLPKKCFEHLVRKSGFHSWSLDCPVLTQKNSAFSLSGKAAFERDCLQLARDVATLGQLLEAEDRSANFIWIWSIRVAFGLGWQNLLNIRTFQNCKSHSCVL